MIFLVLKERYMMFWTPFRFNYIFYIVISYNYKMQKKLAILNCTLTHLWVGARKYAQSLAVSTKHDGKPFVILYWHFT